MKRKITLLKVKTGQGNKPDTIEVQKKVWAEISEAGVTTKYAAEAAGRKAEMQGVMWRREWGNFTHVELDGVRYRVQDTGGAKNELQVKLILVRG